MILKYIPKRAVSLFRPISFSCVSR